MLSLHFDFFLVIDLSVLIFSAFDACQLSQKPFGVSVDVGVATSAELS